MSLSPKTDRLRAMHLVWADANREVVGMLNMAVSFHLFLTVHGQRLPDELKAVARELWGWGRLWEKDTGYVTALAQLKGEGDERV